MSHSNPCSFAFTVDGDVPSPFGCVTAYAARSCDPLSSSRQLPVLHLHWKHKYPVAKPLKPEMAPTDDKASCEGPVLATELPTGPSAVGAHGAHISPLPCASSSPGSSSSSFSTSSRSLSNADASNTASSSSSSMIDKMVLSSLSMLVVR